MKLNNVI